MTRRRRTWTGALALACWLVPAAGTAGELKLEIANGRVTLSAQGVSVTEILREWGRVGQATIVNVEKLAGGPVTLELHGVPEREALDILLRSAAGYMAAPRAAALPGASIFDRVIVLATSTAPAAVMSPAAAAFPQPNAPAGPPNAPFRGAFGQPQPADQGDSTETTDAEDASAGVAPNPVFPGPVPDGAAPTAAFPGAGPVMPGPAGMTPLLPGSTLQTQTGTTTPVSPANPWAPAGVSATPGVIIQPNPPTPTVNTPQVP